MHQVSRSARPCLLAQVSEKSQSACVHLLNRSLIIVESAHAIGVYLQQWPACNLTRVELLMLALVVAADGQRAVKGIHSQDPIHNAKKLMNPLDSAKRTLTLGSHMATMSHVSAMADQMPFDQHGLRHNDIARKDRQNWAACQRLAFRRVRTSLQNSIGQASIGTQAYLEVNAHCCLPALYVFT